MYDIDQIVETAFEFDDFAFDLKLRHLILRLKQRSIQSEMDEINERLKNYPPEIQHHIKIRIEMLKDIRDLNLKH